jgi:Kef-type K+ transport system membrane component KefB
MKWSKGIVYAALAMLLALPVTVEAQFRMPQGTGLPTSPISSIIGRTMNWLLAMFGMIAVIAFVISGIQYMMAAGDESQAETAKRNMKYSIIGVMVGLAAYVIISAIGCVLGSNTINAGFFSVSLWSC